MLAERSLAAKIAIAEETRVVHVVYGCSILFVPILGLMIKKQMQDVSLM